MSGEVHLHRKVVGSLNLGILSNYLLYAFFWGGVQLILNRGSRSIYIYIYIEFLMKDRE